MQTGTCTVAAILCSALIVSACEPDPGQVTAENDAVSTLQHEHASAKFSPSPEFQKKMAELRRWSAEFHNIEKAMEAGYTVMVACVDERVNGVDASEARGMGYHVTRGDVDLIGDGVLDIDMPEFLVYAPHPNDADLPPEERLKAARLVAFDYYLQVPIGDDPGDPPVFLGEELHWSTAFNGWIRHYWIWGHNPDGITSDFNPDVPLCTD